MELYHVLNRGVEKRTLFLDSMDYARFVHDMYEFNDRELAGNAYRRFKSGKMVGLRNPSSERVPIVDIHGWCLMGNHYHLLLSERVENGLSTFLRKLNVGFANYFNEKYERSGTLFQGRTKKILIGSDSHFLHVLHYIHLNPLDFCRGSEKWRELKIRKAERALNHLDKYRWSSYRDYCGTKNFPSILNTGLFANVFPNYRKTLSSYMRDMELSDVGEFLLE